MAELTLRLITPDHIVLDTQASRVQVPAIDGLMGILPRHASLVTALDVGPLTYESGGKEESIFVSGGFAEVRDNTVRIVSEAGGVCRVLSPWKAAPRVVGAGGVAVAVRKETVRGVAVHSFDTTQGGVYRMSPPAQ